ncbi:MAG: hypothetical protein HYS80_00560 [Candidatus Aenigmarchaeota archaeon]|nr:hypothetical protein [Candidatus Aenigmarchaeota archaeon]
MHLHSRESLLISTFLIALSILMSSVLAAVVEVSLMPLQTSPDKSVEFSLSVKNLAGDNVNKVELVVPQTDSVPLYLIKEIGSPAGWTYETRYTVGAPAPFRIIWSTADSGVSAGKSLNFNFVTTSPNAGGNYEFEWKAADLKGEEDFDKVKVTNFNPTLTSFEVKAPNSTSAGKEFDFAVAALDQNGNKKGDYTGTVEFSSSDPMVILPSDYAFQLANNGVKTFKIKLKTAGEQEVKVADGSVEKSVKINIQQSDISSVELELSNDTALPNTLVAFTMLSTDVYGNTNDITEESTFEIDKEAKGALVNHTYTTEIVGKWTVTATYTKNGLKFSDGALLTVVAELPKPKEDVKAPEPEKKVSMEIVSDDMINVEFNSTKLFSLTVKNTGDADISNVSIYFSGFPEKWVGISPSITNINKGKSQRFTITVSAPEFTEPSDVEFIALSSEYSSDKLNASKIIQINVTEISPVQEAPETGKVVLGKNLTYLGIAIVTAVVLIILFWALFLREEPKKKKAE